MLSRYDMVPVVPFTQVFPAEFWVCLCLSVSGEEHIHLLFGKTKIAGSHLLPWCIPETYSTRSRWSIFVQAECLSYKRGKRKPFPSTGFLGNADKIQIERLCIPLGQIASEEKYTPQIVYIIIQLSVSQFLADTVGHVFACYQGF